MTFVNSVAHVQLHSHTWSALTRFLKRAVSSLVNTENLRKAEPRSGSSRYTQFSPNFSRAWVYCSSFSTWAERREVKTWPVIQSAVNWVRAHKARPSHTITIGSHLTQHIIIIMWGTKTSAGFILCDSGGHLRLLLVALWDDPVTKEL